MINQTGQIWEMYGQTLLVVASELTWSRSTFQHRVILLDVSHHGDSAGTCDTLTESDTALRWEDRSYLTRVM